MPRDGSGIYTTPAGTTAVPDTTIESAKYNANVADVAADLNAARPIVAGGTGGNSAATARANLQAEVAAQQVTNYDTHVFQSGSFYSQPGATAQPVNSNISGDAVIIASDPNYITITARDNSTGIGYVRHKTAGVWSAWSSEASDKVAKAGDTMTGDLTINKVSPVVALTKNASGQNSGLYGNLGTTTRWFLALGDGATESGANVGSDFGLYRYNDAGVFTDAAFAINRATGRVSTGNGHSAVNAKDVVTKDYADTKVAKTGDTMTGGLIIDGDYPRIRINANGGQNSSIEFKTAGTMNWSITSDPNQAIFTGGSSDFRLIYANGELNNSGTIKANGYFCRQGIGGATGSIFNSFWTSPNLQAWIDFTNIGNITYTSDYRIKKDVADLPSTWDAVKALRPVSYTQAQFTAPNQIKANVEAKLKYERVPEVDEQGNAKPYEPPQPTFVADDIPRWGFIAHEVQAALLPTAAEGVKDDPGTVQSLNLGPIVASLTKALQEAMARIEALEAAASVPVR